MAEYGANKRIIVNTFTIYIRLILTLSVSLFSTRYVLEALGETDYGLYNVIAGTVSMLSFIAATMATTSQRFISFSMGESKDINKLKTVVGSSLTLHFIGAFVVAVVVLIGGWLMIDNLLTIPEGKHNDAIFVLVSVSLGLIGTILSVPFEALLMAHENILFVSFCQVVNALVKFGGALSLLYIDANLLRVYAVIMATLPFILLALEFWYSFSYYPETRISRNDLRPGVVMKSLGAFVGWVMIGTTCYTIRTQGVSVFLNVFWGVAVNAANGVATQVNSTVEYFSTSITTSLRPQLVKSAGGNNIERMLSLVFAACKYPLLLTALVGCPLLVAMPYVLSIWLKVVPEYTVQFCRLLIICTMFRQVSVGLFAGLEAKGFVKALHSGNGVLQMLILVLGYFAAKMGCPPQSIYCCVIIVTILIIIYALYLSYKNYNLPVNKFFVDIILRASVVIISSILIDYIVWNSLQDNFLSFIIFVIISIVVSAFLVLAVGLNISEQMYVLSHVKQRIHFKIHKK